MEIVPHLTKCFEARSVFNAHECALFFMLIPNKSHVLKGEKCHGVKICKEGITILLAVNSDGTEKLPSLAIGKYANPRCFKNVKRLPCDYKNQRRARMTAELFHAWLLDLDKKIIRKKRKLVLFIDNCPSHAKNVQLKNLRVEFLPPNATSKLQPLDQGIIKVLKQYYINVSPYSILRKLIN